jgi:hypothetical protein
MRAPTPKVPGAALEDGSSGDGLPTTHAREHQHKIALQATGRSEATRQLPPRVASYHTLHCCRGTRSTTRQEAGGQGIGGSTRATLSVAASVDNFSRRHYLLVHVLSLPGHSSLPLLCLLFGGLLPPFTAERHAGAC